jgi:hypothetical protein
MFYKVYFEIVLGFGINVVLQIDQVDVFMEVVMLLGQSFYYLVLMAKIFFNDGPSKSVLM